MDIQRMPAEMRTCATEFRENAHDVEDVRLGVAEAAFRMQRAAHPDLGGAEEQQFIEQVGTLASEVDPLLRRLQRLLTDIDNRVHSSAGRTETRDEDLARIFSTLNGSTICATPSRGS